MTTARQIFDISMILIDEVPVNGVFDADRTTDYLAKAPYLLTMLQDELIRDSNYYKTETITITSSVPTDGGYIAHTMASDFYSASQVISIEVQGTYQQATDFKWEGNNVLLIPDSFVGTYKIIYLPIPTPITAMTDVMVLDDITCRTTIANALASQLITKENPDLSQFLNQRYLDLKNKQKQPAGINKIIDKYDSTLSY